MEWVILLVNLGLAGLLGRLWFSHLERAQDLRSRQEQACLRTEEHLQEIDKTHEAVQEVEGQLPELEEQAQMLKGEINAANGNLARLKSTEEGLHPSRHQL